MENTAYISLSGMTALQRQVDVIANNMANMNTPSFKAQFTVVNEYRDRTTFKESVAMAQDFAVLRDLRAGPLETTDNPFDLAVDGDGFFAIETSSGPRYTRDGGFSMDANRVIVNRAGLPVLDDQNRPIQVPEVAGDLRIHPTGEIQYTDNTNNTINTLATIRLVRFENPNYMKPLGEGLYETEESPLPVTNTKIVQFAREGSNVNPILTMTEMMDVQRRYSSAQKLLDTEDERARQMLQRLGKASSG
jgi:flagellar basal-body rod protein FlgF